MSTASGLTILAAPRRMRNSFPFTLTFAGAMLATVFALILVVPLAPGYDPYTQDLFDGLLPPLSDVDGKLYALGTDTLGRDLLSRLALAGRISLFIAAVAVVISLVMGVTLGLIAGFFGGRTSFVIMGLADIQLSVPRILLLIGVAALVGTSIYDLMAVLGLTSWVAYCRLARALTMSLREREFVLAATTQGASPLWIIRKHLLPNVLTPMIIVAGFELGQMIVLEASLSYLGVGVQPPMPSWGAMINEGQDTLQSNPWMALIPGFAIFMLVAGVQFVSRHFSPEGRRPTTLLSRA